MSQQKILFAGPWVGEFGWELFCWQGYLRSQAHRFDKIAVSARPGHEVLYEDFAHKFIPYQTKTNITDAHNCVGEENAKYFHQRFEKTAHISGSFFIGYHLEEPELSTKNFKNQKFIKYGNYDKEKEFDILIHARATEKLHTSCRNWSVENWSKIVDKFSDLKFGSIGTLDGAHHIPGTTNLIGLPLRSIVDHMASSKLIAGPSSGPIHLAALCDLPQVVWSGSKRNKQRYEKYWNPFNTKVHYIDQYEQGPGPNGNSWDVDVDTVVKGIETIL